MSFLRRTAGRLLRTLPDPWSRRVRRRARALERRLRGPRDTVTYVVSPHPDDETLRLAGFVAGLRERTPGRLVLVAVSDGGSSGRARAMGWSPEDERAFRRAEQATAWSSVTGGTGEVIRVGLPDGAVTAEAVRDALAPLDTTGARFYVAAHEDDYHPDHRAVAAGVRLLDPAYARFSLAPMMTGTGTVHRPGPGSVEAVAAAVAAYEDFGQLSASNEFRALVEAGYWSRVTEWSGDDGAGGDAPNDDVPNDDAPHDDAADDAADDATPEPGMRAHDRDGGARVDHPEAPIFVLGSQKAGTTAIAALLAECVGGTFVSDVLHGNGLHLEDLLGEDTGVAELARSHPDSFRATVVKDNDFTFVHPALAREFPRARFVFVVRDPRHNIRSVLNRLKLPGDLDALPDERYAWLEEELPGWHTILTGASFGAPPGHYIDVLADRWVRANEAYVQAPDQMVLVRYEDFDADKRPVVERLATDLGHAVVNDISASQDRQFQPRGNRSISPAAFFGAENLARIERRCGPLMGSFGYRPS